MTLCADLLSPDSHFSWIASRKLTYIPKVSALLDWKTECFFSLSLCHCPANLWYFKLSSLYKQASSKLHGAVPPLAHVVFYACLIVCLSQVNFSRRFRLKPLAVFVNTELIFASRLQNCVWNTTCYISPAQNDRKKHSIFLIAQGKTMN